MIGELREAVYELKGQGADANPRHAEEMEYGSGSPRWRLMESVLRTGVNPLQRAAAMLEKVRLEPGLLQKL